MHWTKNMESPKLIQVSSHMQIKRSYVNGELLGLLIHILFYKQNYVGVRLERQIGHDVSTYFHWSWEKAI